MESMERERQGQGTLGVSEVLPTSILRSEGQAGKNQPPILWLGKQKLREGA